jgi:ankyrin repeat protein
MASFGHQEIARQLLEKSAEVNKSDEHGQTPLHIAVFMGKIEMVRLLLEYNADVNKADNLVKFNNQTVLIIDSFIDSESVFRFSSE